MDFKDKYVKRLNVQGIDSKEAYINKSKIINSLQIKNSPTSSKVYIDLDESEFYYCIINDLDGYEKRKFIFTNDTVVHIGSYVTVDEFTYLLLEKETNIVTPQLVGRLCSSEFPIGYTEEYSVYKGDDHLGNPVYETVKGDTIYTPCVVEMNSASVAIADNNNAINLLDNKIIITIPFIKSDEIKINEQFMMYDLNYRIIRVDETKSIKGVGIVIITGELTGIGGTS